MVESQRLCHQARSHGFSIDRNVGSVNCDLRGTNSDPRCIDLVIRCVDTGANGIQPCLIQALCKTLAKLYITHLNALANHLKALPSEPLGNIAVLASVVD